MTKAKVKALTVREAAFVRQMPLCDWVGSKAAIAANYSERTAKQIAHQLMQKPHIAAAIEELKRKSLSGLDISAERILRERARLALYDIGDVAGAQISGPQDIAKLPDHIRQAVTGWKWDKLGNFVMQFADKNPHLTAIEKINGMYSDDTNKGAVFNITIHLEQSNAKPAQIIEA